jgi:hypothetical protein
VIQRHGNPSALSEVIGNFLFATSLSWVQVETLRQFSIVYISCAKDASAALTDTGQIYTWGKVKHTQLDLLRTRIFIDSTSLFLAFSIRSISIKMGFFAGKLWEVGQWKNFRILSLSRFSGNPT